MGDEDNSTEERTDESNEAATGDESPDSSSHESGTSVDSTTSDSSVDESGTSDSTDTSDSSESDPSESSTASDLFGSESSTASDSSESSTASATGGGSGGYAPDSSSGPDASPAASTVEVETPRSETATHSGSSLSDSSARVMAAASPSEEATLRRVRAVSNLLDDAFRIPGTNYRIGIDPILGILPVAGDAIPTLLSFYPIVEAYRVGAPPKMLAKMAALVGIDAVVGSVPVIGTIFDAVWKANKWNLRMLERHIEQR